MLRKLLLLCLPLTLGCFNMKSMPDGFAYRSEAKPAAQVEFLTDMTWVDKEGVRHVDQQIFDEIFRLITNARQFVLLDMFLYNDFQGKSPELTRPLSRELTDHLLQRKSENHELRIYLITDPINTVYGGIPSQHFTELRDAGIDVLETNLDKLRDSNPCYSLPWRLFIRPFGNAEGDTMPNPFGAGRVSLRSWMKMLNFKANHRKVLVVDDGNTLTGLVTSANPHDGSSAHRNAALKFSGGAAWDLLESELPIYDLSSVERPEFQVTPPREEKGDYEVSILTELNIKHAVLELIDSTVPEDEIDLVMFYLSDRKIINALKRADKRDVGVRIVLDPNKDAFGWKKNGIPNRQVAKELVRKGIPLRWCDTHGEQCHGKTLIVRRANGEINVLAGSANFTRRNLNNLNLETDALVSASIDSEFGKRVSNYFELIWNNEENRLFTVPYDVYKDESAWKTGLYRFQEATGMSTF